MVVSIDSEKKVVTFNNGSFTFKDIKWIMELPMIDDSWEILIKSSYEWSENAPIAYKEYPGILRTTDNTNIAYTSGSWVAYGPTK